MNEILFCTQNNMNTIFSMFSCSELVVKEYTVRVQACSNFHRNERQFKLTNSPNLNHEKHMENSGESINDNIETKRVKITLMRSHQLLLCFQEVETSQIVIWQ